MTTLEQSKAEQTILKVVEGLAPLLKYYRKDSLAIYLPGEIAVDLARYYGMDSVDSIMGVKVVVLPTVNSEEVLVCQEV